MQRWRWATKVRLWTQASILLVIHPDDWNINKWKHGDHPLKPLPQFTTTPGINFDIPEDANELYFFKLFFTDDVLEYLPDETMMILICSFFSSKQRQDHLLASKNGISSGRMKPFLALIFYFGIMKKDLLKSYWSTNSVLITPFPRTVSRCQEETFIIYCHF